MHTPDATLFIKFIRMIRKMLYVMTFLGVCVIIPINIVATSFTGYVFYLFLNKKSI
jgi:hypothetical protein